MSQNDYFNPFHKQPLRFLWWLDDTLHKHHSPGRMPWYQRPLCDYLDHKLLGK